MPEALSSNSGLGMNVAVIPFLRATFLTTYLYIIRLSAMRVMVVSLDRDAEGFHRQHHLAAQILHAVDGGSRKISLFLARFMAEVGGLLCAGVPGAFL